MSRPGPRGAGMRDLSKAVATVHNHRAVEPIGTEEIDRELLWAAGDAPGRASFFEHDDSRQVFEKDGASVHLTMSPRALLHDYRDTRFRREHRSQLTIPPKLREKIRVLYGLQEGDDFLITTTLIALADYAAMMLVRDGRRLHVEPAPDPREGERRKLKRRIARANP